LERLAACTREPDPVECIWTHLTPHEIGNLLARDGREPGQHAIRAVRKLRRRPGILLACRRQSEFCR
jgi:hypothetical protein